MELTTKDKLRYSIIKYGTENTGYIKLNVESLNIVIDGRFADEYEDLSSPAPCKVDYIRLQLDDISMSFHMYTNFASGFPLSSNDQYSIGLIEDYFETIINKFKVDPKEYNEKKFDILKIQKILESTRFNFRLTKLTKQTDFGHVVDCSYSCYDKTRKDNYSSDYENLAEFKNDIIDNVSENLCAKFRILYKDYESFKSSNGYLAYQTSLRYFRYRKIMAEIWEKVINTFPTENDAMIHIQKIIKK